MDNNYTPNTDVVRLLYAIGQGGLSDDVEDMRAEDFDRWLAGVKAEAWDEGHRHRQRRGPDDCPCGAWYEGECACGQYGTGDLLSLADNPYREEESDD